MEIKLSGMGSLLEDTGHEDLRGPRTTWAVVALVSNHTTWEDTLTGDITDVWYRN